MTRWLRRFSVPQQWAHWIYALFFGVLAATGIVIAFSVAGFVVGEAGAMTRLFHRAAAVGLILMVVYYAVFGYKSAGRDMRLIVSWSKNDLKWLWRAATRFYWTGRRGDLPEEGRYNAGQKLNYLGQLVGFGVLTVTGLIMWLGVGGSSAGWFKASVILHDLATVLVVGLFAVHFYLTTMHPLTKESITGMITGKVTEEYAREHHPAWLREVEAGEAEEDDIEGSGYQNGRRDALITGLRRRSS